MRTLLTASFVSLVSVGLLMTTHAQEPVVQVYKSPT